MLVDCKHPLGSVVRFENLVGVNALALYAATPDVPLLPPPLSARQTAQRAFFQIGSQESSVREVALGSTRLPLNTTWLVSGTLISSGGAPVFSATPPSYVLLPQEMGQQTRDGWVYVWAKTDRGLNALLALHPGQGLISTFVFDKPLARKELASESSGYLFNNDGTMYQGVLRDIALAMSEGRSLLRVGAVSRFETTSSFSALSFYIQDASPQVAIPPASVTPPSSSSSSSGMCWVNGYTRKNGTYVSGYFRRC